ncbi:MAG TPA: maleylpyruvate isomerase N-terminal domain-containing protein [Candidatus Limnocylindrales bacterium]
MPPTPKLPKAEFAFPGPLRDSLVAAILRGEKTSTAGLMLDYEEENEPLPVVGELSEVVDSGDRPIAVIQTDAFEVCRLGDVDLPHAIDEGEGYETVAQWRAGHERFWRSYRPDLAIDDDLPLMLVRFHVVRRVFHREPVAAAFEAEAMALSLAMRATPAADAERPTCCPPWTVKDEFAHTAMATARTLAMLDEPPPTGDPVPAAAYYVPTKRFEPQANADRVDTARALAAQEEWPALLDGFSARWQAVARRVDAEPADRTVTTRWGDPMWLTDFLVTRVVEVAVHGLDLADALAVPPWLTESASDIVEALILPAGAHAVRQRVGWDRPTFLRKTTGRAPLTAAERSTLDASGTTWLTLG